MFTFLAIDTVVAMFAVFRATAVCTMVVFTLAAGNALIANNTQVLSTIYAFVFIADRAIGVTASIWVIAIVTFSSAVDWTVRIIATGVITVIVKVF
jgi:hypothetical protein